MAARVPVVTVALEPEGEAVADPIALTDPFAELIEIPASDTVCATVAMAEPGELEAAMPVG